jgi:hypothetical protein
MDMEFFITKMEMVLFCENGNKNGRTFSGGTDAEM